MKCTSLSLNWRFVQFASKYLSASEWTIAESCDHPRCWKCHPYNSRQTTPFLIQSQVWSQDAYFEICFINTSESFMRFIRNVKLLTVLSLISVYICHVTKKTCEHFKSLWQYDRNCYNCHFHIDFAKLLVFFQQKNYQNSKATKVKPSSIWPFHVHFKFLEIDVLHPRKSLSVWCRLCDNDDIYCPVKPLHGVCLIPVSPRYRMQYPRNESVWW